MIQQMNMKNKIEECTKLYNSSTVEDVISLVDISSVEFVSKLFTHAEMFDHIECLNYIYENKI